MNIVQISLLLGHEHLQTTMVYLDITNDEKAAALATLDDETCKKVTPKWKNTDGSLISNQLICSAIITKVWILFWFG